MVETGGRRSNGRGAFGYSKEFVRTRRERCQERAIEWNRIAAARTDVVLTDGQVPQSIRAMIVAAVSGHSGERRATTLLVVPPVGDDLGAHYWIACVIAQRSRDRTQPPQPRNHVVDPSPTGQPDWLVGHHFDVAFAARNRQ